MGRKKKAVAYVGAERRGARRFPFWVMAACKELMLEGPEFTSGHSSQEFFASTRNISEDGMLLEAFERIKPGAFLSIRLNGVEDDGLQYSFLGKVMYNEKLDKTGLHGLGIKLVQKQLPVEKLLR